MIPLPSDITGKDVHQWLDGGWFYAKLPDVDEYKISRLAHVAMDATVAEVMCVSGESAVLPFSSLYAYWPLCGALNIIPDPINGVVGKYAVSLIRLQKKQWKRTYNAYCLKMRPLSDQAAHFQINADNRTVVKAAFNPEYFTYTEAVKFRFPDGWTSVAINPNLVVMKIPNQQMVFVDGEVIGMIDDNTNIFTCVNPGLKRRLLPQFDYRVE